MADYKKNYTSGFINPFDSSKEFAFDRITANTFDSVEGSLLSSTFRKKFKCVLLSGKDAGIFKATNSSFLPNMPELIDLGDGIGRWKSAFTIHESLYDTALGAEFTSLYGKSPLISGLPAHIVQSRISKMPMAYTDIDNSYYSGLHYGSIVDILQRHGTFFIVGQGGDIVATTTTQTNQSTLDQWLNGKQYTLDATHYDSQIETLPKDYWIEILHNVMAEGNQHMKVTGKPCKRGKTYKDFCTGVDGGNVGIAHFANRSLNNLLAFMIKDPPYGYGQATVEGWFGKPVKTLKQIFPKCFMPYDGVQRAGTIECSKKFDWYVKGWRKFIAEYDGGATRQAKMIKIQQDTYKAKKVKKAEEIVKRENYPINMRNMAIVLGIINSYGSWGNFRGKNPEQALVHYGRLKPTSGHRAKRIKLIKENYPMKKPTAITK